MFDIKNIIIFEENLPHKKGDINKNHYICRKLSSIWMNLTRD